MRKMKRKNKKNKRKMPRSLNLTKTTQNKKRRKLKQISINWQIQLTIQLPKILEMEPKVNFSLPEETKIVGQGNKTVRIRSQLT